MNTMRFVLVTLVVTTILLLGITTSAQDSISLGNIPSLEVKVIRRDLSMRLDEVCAIVESTEESVFPVISCKTVTSDESGLEVSVYQDSDNLYESEDYELWWIEVERVGLNMYWAVLVPKQPNGQPSLG